ncbi:MAG TPA: hypothetical protein VIJ51_04470 [Solirubrobacteraceae bacterium]
MPQRHRHHQTSRALGLLAELPTGEWRAALSVLERSALAPPHEVYALFAAAAPTMTWSCAHRLLLDIVYPPSGLRTS